MNQLEQLRLQIRKHLLLLIFLENSALVGLLWAADYYSSLSPFTIVLGTLGLGLALAIILVFKVSNYVLQPLQAIWQTVLHLNPTEHGITAPKLEEINLGRELVTNLASQIHQLYDLNRDA